MLLTYRFFNSGTKLATILEGKCCYYKSSKCFVKACNMTIDRQLDDNSKDL